VDTAARTMEGARFLSWARFPWSHVEPLPDGACLVWLLDARYALAPGPRFGAVGVRIERRPGAATPARR